VIVARSLSIEKSRLVLPALMTALFLDVSDDLATKIPTQPEKRERLLQELFRKRKKPVVLFIDEAHDLHGNTLLGLKRLMEIIQAGGGVLSIVLVGHPRLKNDLNRPTMEEIGHRTTKFTFEGLGEDRRSNLDWLIRGALAESVKSSDVIADDALELMAESLSTPLQFAEHLTRAFTEAFELGKKPVTRDIVQETLSRGFDDLDARLARMGYSPKTLADQFDARPTEINKFMQQFPPKIIIQNKQQDTMESKKVFRKLLLYDQYNAAHISRGAVSTDELSLLPPRSQHPRPAEQSAQLLREDPRQSRRGHPAG